MANRDQHLQKSKGNGAIKHYNAVVIGAGFGGLYALHHLRARKAAISRAMATNWGAPTYEFVATSHSIANLSETALNAKADELTEHVERFLADRLE